MSETTAADVPISIVLEKLQKLQALAEERFFFGALGKRVVNVVIRLKQILRFLEAENTSDRKLPDRLLCTVYSAEYVTEILLIKMTQRRRKGIIRMPLMPFLPWSQIQFISKMKEIDKSISAVSIEFAADKSIEPIPQVSAIERHNSTARHLYDQMPDVLVGCGDAEKELVGRLINDDEESLQVVSLFSEEALGKTALARKVYNRLDVRRHFQCRAWLHVPEDFAYKDLLLIIIGQIVIGVVKDIELMSETELSEFLFQILMELRFLIVLDNVRTVDVWLMFVRAFADIANGSRVILTTRHSDVASQVDPWSFPVALKRLTDADSWALFLKKVKVGRPEENSLDNSEHLNNSKVEILKICHGLPPAILLVGGVLSTIELSEWSRVVDHLAHFGGQDDLSALLNVVTLSYHELPSVLRPCFLYLAFFPQMYEIPTRRLLHLWLAEEFVQTSTKASVPEDIAQSYLDELVCRNMIEIARRKPDGSPKTVRMPSFLYDVFLPKAKDIGFLHVHHCKSDCTSADSPESILIRRLADQYFGVKSTSESHTHQLCSYVSFEAQKRNTSNREIEMLLQIIMKRSGFVLLKVFDLEGIYRPVLPDKLGRLQNLKYIGLRWTGLYSCPVSIGDLPCLETLDVKYTNITTLPRSIWKAKNLRHLYMNEVSIPKPSKQPPTNLQTLMGLHIGSKDPHEYGLNRLTSLRKLRLTCHSKSVEKTVNCISGLGNIQTLKLRSRDPFGQPLDLFLSNALKVHQSLSNLNLFGVITGGIDNLPMNLKTLTLSMSELKEDQMLVLAKLPQLNILGLYARSYAGTQMVCLPGNFPELRVLKLWMLEKLEEWTVEEGAMPLLQELEIRGCGKLGRVDGLEHLPAVKELILTNMAPDFVAAVANRVGRDILLTNNWNACSLVA